MARDPRSPTEIDEYIARRIKQARMESGISQAALGDAIGVSFQMVQKIERADNRIASSRLVVLAQALGKPITYFVPRQK